jgi:hypothetical protein
MAEASFGIDHGTFDANAEPGLSPFFSDGVERAAQPGLPQCQVVPDDLSVVDRSPCVCHYSAELVLS